LLSVGTQAQQHRQQVLAGSNIPLGRVLTFTDYSVPIIANVCVLHKPYYEAQTNSLGAVSGVNNNFNFAFRIVSEFEKHGLWWRHGQLRYDFRHQQATARAAPCASI